MEVKDIKIKNINISESNIRKNLDAGTEDSNIDELAESINEVGLLNPITVKRIGMDTYELIAGQRRYQAYSKLGKDTIPAIIKKPKDETNEIIISLIENVHRADVNPIDKAKAFTKIYEKSNTYKEVAQKTGFSASTVKKYLDLLNLSPEIQELLSTEKGPAGIGTLSKLASTFDHGEQKEVLDQINGFNQETQKEIIKLSNGDLDKVAELRESALAGKFDTVKCSGLVDCPYIPDPLKDEVEKLINRYKQNYPNIKEGGL